MDATDLVRTLFGAVPAHRTFGLTVRPAQVDGIVPLGATASLAFRAPARGVLVARCELTDDQRRVLGTVFTAAVDRVRMTTSAEVVDEGGTVVCVGTFEWSVRRTRP